MKNLSKNNHNIFLLIEIYQSATIITRLLIISAFLLFYPFSLNAQESISSLKKVPAEISANLKNVNLIGEYDLKVYGFNVYHIELWSESKKFSYQEKFAIYINYKLAFSVKNLVQRSIEEISRINNIKDQELLENYSKILNSVFRDVKKGDTKTVIYDEKNGAVLFFNGKKIGKIDDLKLARYFVDIWLSENSSYPKMTNKILGKN